MDRASIRLNWDKPSPEEFRSCLAKVFASLDERPRKLTATIDTRNRAGAVFSIDIEKGEPVFVKDGKDAVKGNFRGRWIAEHPVPLLLPNNGRMKLVFEPADANRVRVRMPKLTELMLV